MASSNRHWPSMFKSKPCNSHHQWQHDINPLHHQKSPYSSSVSAGFEERSPEPKPRWNPKPEQIRILEAIFNSGMVNPPRDEIRKIRAQLQEYGQVGDANVFYWFQNRKSRSKNKQRHLQTARSQPSPPSSFPAAPPAAAGPNKPPAATSSSSSSEHSTGSDKTTLFPPPASVGCGGGGVLTSMVHASASLPPMNPAVYLHAPLELSGGEPFLLQGPQGYCLSAADVAGIIGGAAAAPAEHALGVYPGLWSELIGQIHASKDEETKAKMQLHHHLYGIGAPPAASAVAAAVTGASTTSNINATAITGVNNSSSTAAGGATTAATALGEIQGIVGDGGGAAAAQPRSSSTVFINEVAFEVTAGPLNVRDAFGGEAILLDHSGRPVLTDEWGVTIHPLQHGASYYLV